MFSPEEVFVVLLFVGEVVAEGEGLFDGGHGLGVERTCLLVARLFRTAQTEVEIVVPIVDTIE